jgi:hypothetical protein
MLRKLICLILGLPLIVLLLQTTLRVIRYFYKFPMPQFLANLIENPFRRKIQPPRDMPLRHGLEPGMTVLEVGPGNGRYTLATARRVGSTGKVISATSLRIRWFLRSNQHLSSRRAAVAQFA